MFNVTPVEVAEGPSVAIKLKQILRGNVEPLGDCVTTTIRLYNQIISVHTHVNYPNLARFIRINSDIG